MAKFTGLLVTVVMAAGIFGGSAMADPVGGRRQQVTRVGSYATDSFVLSCNSGEVTRVRISGDGDTRLDLYVYDEDDNLVKCAVGSGDDKEVTFVPRWTGKFVVRVVNRGSVYNRYAIVAD